jgi:ankyrin repeat protein
MPSALLTLLYRGDRPAAQALACELTQLDIFEAAALGALEAIIERAEEDPACVNASADDGWTPLHFAAYFGNNACVKELLRRGARVDTSAASSGLTPLHSARAGGHTVVAATLVAAGANVNALASGGHRPLDSARQNANAELVALLNAAGANAGDAVAPPT